MSHQDLHVKLASFEGPLDLLLYLIRQNEMDIREIKISEITGHYLRMLELMREYNLNLAGDFILMAANLILIKSRHILPQLEEEESMEEEPFLSEELLRKRLLEHQQYQEIASQLKAFPKMNNDYFKHPVEPKKAKDSQSMLVEMTLTDLSLAFQKILSNKRTATQKLQKEAISIEEAIHFIHQKVSMKEAIELNELLPQKSKRSEVIAIFLAILELTRLQKISILQHVMHGSIYVIGKETFNLDEIHAIFRAGESYEYESPQVSS